MFSTLRTRFGIPGVISVIALVFALVGGAYAANNSSSGGKATASAKAKKGPRGPKGATGPAGPAGAQGPAGPAGAKGDAGANGSNGATGPTGPQGLQGNKGATGAAGAAGAQGSPWTAGGTLPSGKTETGSWVIAAASSSKPLTTEASISFPIPLAAESPEGSAWAFTALQAENEEWGRKESTGQGCKLGEPECKDTGCRGSAAEPKAPTGTLCIYTALETLNRDRTEVIVEEEEVDGEIKIIERPVPVSLEVRNFSFGFNAYGVSGASMWGPTIGQEYKGAPNPAVYEANGTWAVTAP